MPGFDGRTGVILTDGDGYVDLVTPGSTQTTLPISVFDTSGNQTNLDSVSIQGNPTITSTFSGDTLGAEVQLQTAEVTGDTNGLRVNLGANNDVSLNAGTNTIGYTTLEASDTTIALDIFRTLDLDETEEDIKTAETNLYGYYFYNASTAVMYLKMFNATAASVTVGTTAPAATLPLPPDRASGHVSFDPPIKFGTALSVAVTTGLSDTALAGPAANTVVFNAFYK